MKEEVRKALDELKWLIENKLVNKVERATELIDEVRADIEDGFIEDAIQKAIELWQVMLEMLIIRYVAEERMKQLMRKDRLKVEEVKDIMWIVNNAEQIVRENMERGARYLLRYLEDERISIYTYMALMLKESLETGRVAGIEVKAYRITHVVEEMLKDYFLDLVP